MRFSHLAATILLASCQQHEEPDPPGSTASTTPSAKVEAPVNAGSAAPASTEVPADTPPPPPIARSLTLTQWRKADNRRECAALALTDNGGANADARPASFAGGWAVAFDQRGSRSLYGIAGTGVRIDNPSTEAVAVRKQWPYFRDLGGGRGKLPTGSMAGYGVEGAGSYPPSNADGAGLNSLAYVVIPGQHCLYNAWSRLGRRHLETLVDGLTLVVAD